LLHELVAEGGAEHGAVELADVVPDILVPLGDAGTGTGRLGVGGENLAEDELGFLAVADGVKLLEGVTALGRGRLEELDLGLAGNHDAKEA
jgi:hypothetical protein